MLRWNAPLPWLNKSRPPRIRAQANPFTIGSFYDHDNLVSHRRRISFHCDCKVRQHMKGIVCKVPREEPRFQNATRRKPIKVASTSAATVYAKFLKTFLTRVVGKILLRSSCQFTTHNDVAAMRSRCVAASSTTCLTVNRSQGGARQLSNQTLLPLAIGRDVLRDLVSHSKWARGRELQHAQGFSLESTETKRDG